MQAILRSSQTFPIEHLVNTGAVRIDVANQRIFRDIYWKGSFAADSLLGWEERARTKLLHPEVFEHGKIFAGGSFWKRFDKVEDGVATGQVVNYEIEALPGDPEVRTVPYPDSNEATSQRIRRSSCCITATIRTARCTTRSRSSTRTTRSA